jgi:hypothetical protein
MEASRFHDLGGLRLLQAYSDCTDDVTGDVDAAISCLNDGCVSCDVAAEIVQDGSVTCITFCPNGVEYLVTTMIQDARSGLDDNGTASI